MSGEKRHGAMTAAEFIALREERLRTDPEYRAAVQAVEAERQAREKELREAERPIVADLQLAGQQVNSVWDLVNTSVPYPAALPVLIEHLERGGYPDRVMEGLGRALAVKPSVTYWDRLRARYLAARGPGEEEGAAIALAACATAAQIDDLIGFLSLTERGQTRIYFVQPILRLGGQRGRKVIESFESDGVLGTEARASLKRRRTS